jgi:glycosyltransferase involved in cell wall biosynthesis
MGTFWNEMMAQLSGDQPAVTVVVPMYNSQELIGRTVGSLLEQDFAHSYEIVVVDDGSEDGSAEAVAGIDPRVRLVRQPHRGAPAARLRGIEAARAPLVAFQDSDDVAYPNKLSCLWTALQAYPEAVLAFGLARLDAWQRVRLPAGIDCKEDGRMILLEDPLPLLVRNRTIISCMNLMTYRWAALAGGKVSSFYKASNDYRLHLGVARYGPFVCVDQALCNYRWGRNGITRTWGVDRQLAFSLHAADAAFRRSEPRHALIEAMRARVEEDGPDLAVKLASMGDGRMLASLLPIVLRHARWRHLPRSLWWALDKTALDNPRTAPLWVRMLSRTGRALRARVPGRP